MGSFSFRVLINSQHVLRNWHRPNCILCDLFCYKKEIVFYTFGDWFGLVSGFALYRVIRLRARKHRCKFLRGWLGRSTPWGSSCRGHQWSLVLGRQAESCQWLLWGTVFVSVRFPLWCDPYRISQGPHFTSFSLEKLLQNFPVPPLVAEQEPGSSVLHRSHGLYVNTLARCHLLSWCSPLCRMSLRLLQHPAQHLNCSPDCSHWCAVTGRVAGTALLPVSDSYSWYQLNMKSKPFVSWIFYQQCYLLTLPWMILLYSGRTWCWCFGLTLLIGVSGFRLQLSLQCIWRLTCHWANSSNVRSMA